jgi:hypothetical protein
MRRPGCRLAECNIILICAVPIVGYGRWAIRAVRTENVHANRFFDSDSHLIFNLKIAQTQSQGRMRLYV